MSFDVDDFLGGYKPPRLSVSVTARADLQAELLRLNDEFVSLRPADPVESDALNAPTIDIGEHAQALADRMADLVEEIRASERSFTFQALSAFAWRKLCEAHKPLPAEKAEGHQVHFATFEIAAVAACAVEPTITIEQAEQMRDTLADNQWAKLITAAQTVNVFDDAPPKFDRKLLQAAVLRRSSATPLNTASPDPDSSDE